jgi:hypothetical protein
VKNRGCSQDLTIRIWKVAAVVSSQHATGVCLDDVVVKGDAVDEVDDDDEERGRGKNPML